MAVVNGYCTVDEVRAQFGDTGEKLNTGLLEKSINASSRAIDRHCNRRFWKDAGVTTRTYVVEDFYSAWVDDIATTEGLIVKTDDGLTGMFPITWAENEYQLEPLNGGVDGVTPYAFTQIVATGTRSFPVDYWRQTRATLRITAKHGWSAVPDEVNSACILKSVSLFRRKDAPFGVANFSEFGPVRITRADPDVMDLLGAYKIRMWA
jgi:hypothetical protein